MHINGKGRIDPNALGKLTPGAAERGSPKARVTPDASMPDRPKQDTVSISDEARALAGGSPTEAARRNERVDEVRQRVLLGAYNTAEMAGEVARRILQRGDL